jgi:hypothetical protein
MRKQILIISAGILCLFSYTPTFAMGGSSSGSGGFRINPALSYSTQTDDNGTTATTTKKFGFDLKGDYVLSNGFFFGAIYTSDSFNSTTGSVSSDGYLTGYGPMVGFQMNGFYVNAEYYLSSTYQTTGGTTYKTGSGFGVGVGYLVYFERFFMGPSIDYRSLSYTTADPNNQTLATSYKYSEIRPYLQLGIMF